MLNNSETLSLPQFLAAQRAVEDAAIAFKVSQALALGHMAVQIFSGHQIAQAAAEVCDGEAPFDRRSKASENLIKRWKPYPFAPEAQKALRYAGAQRRAELRDDLILNLLSVAAESARNPKRWRIGRSWIKDENGALAKLSLLDLEARDWIRALRTLTIKQYEKTCPPGWSVTLCSSQTERLRWLFCCVFDFGRALWIARRMDWGKGDSDAFAPGTRAF
jgi:hypothetical protein